MRNSGRVWLWMSVILGALTALPALASSLSPNGEPITIAHRFEIESKVLNETRSYIVHKPRGYDFSNAAYPVIILLDGDANMHHVSASVDTLADTGRAMPMLVVGIENTDRQRDFTPPFTGAKPDDHPEGKVGGAPQFLSFIADELLPHIDRTYRTRPTRILIGHSYGGLFAVHTLFNRPELFKAYIAVSPALWWDNQALAKQADQFVADHQDVQGAVYMTMGNEGGAMLGGAQKVIGSLASAVGSIDATFQHWPEESHGSVVMRSVYEGLEWLHEIYYTHDPMRAYEESGLQFFDKRFALISKYLGYEVKVPEHVLMEIQYHLVHGKRPEEARVVLQRVLQLYPNSPGAHYELGRVYLEINDRRQAQQEFQRALQLYPGYLPVRAALEKLGQDPSILLHESQPPMAELRGYVGEYRYADETSHVTLEDGKLFIRVRNVKRELRAQPAARFYALDADREYTFQKKSGRTVAMTVQLPEFEYESRKLR